MREGRSRSRSRRFIPRAALLVKNVISAFTLTAEKPTAQNP